MKKSAKTDDRAVSELLKKLQASYLKKEEYKSEKQQKKDAADEDDRKFRERLAAMLDKASGGEKPSKKATRSAKKAEVQTSEKEPIIELTVEPSVEPTVEPSVEPTEIHLAKEAPVPALPERPKKSTKKRNRVAKTAQKSESLYDSEPISEPHIESVPLPESVPMLELEPDPEQKNEPESQPIPQAEVSLAPESEIPPVADKEPCSTCSPPPVPKPIAALEPSAEDTEALPQVQEPVFSPASPVPPAVKTVFIPRKQESENVTRIHEADKPIRQTAPMIIRPSNRTSVKAEPSDAIIIPPPAAPKPSADTPIVIKPRPRTASTTVREQLTEKPIKIGKEILPAGQRKIIPNPADKPKPIMKKEQNTTMVPPTSPETPSQKPTVRVVAKGPAAPTKKPGVTLPRTSVKTEKNADDPPHPKKTQTTRKSPVATPASSADPSAEKSSQSAKRSVTLRKPMTPPLIRKKPTPAVKVPLPLDNESLDEVLDEGLVEEISASEPASNGASSPRRSHSHEDETLSATESVYRKEGLSEEDIAMMLSLGYENELAGLVGYETLKRLKSEQLQKNSGSNRKHYRTAFGYRGTEYSSAEQRGDIITAYLQDRKKLLISLILTSLSSLILFFVNFPSLIGSPLVSLDVDKPFLLPLADLCLLLVCTVLSRRQLFAGLRSFFSFRPTPYSLSALVIPISLLYTAVSIFSPLTLPRIGFVASLFLLLTAGCDLLRLGNELRSFRLISSEEAKTVLAPAAPRKKKMRYENKIVKVINDDLGENRYRVSDGVLCVGFFRRFNDMRTAARPFAVCLSLMLSLSVAVGIADAVKTADLSSALSAFMTVLFATAPACALFGYFYPLCLANRLLHKRGCALIGEESVDEYSDPKTVIFRDSELYSAQKQTEISVQDGDILRSDLRLAGILFRKLGGTLGGIGAKLSGGQSDPPVSVLRIRETGVEAIIDESRHMLIGDSAFLQHAGVRVPKESTDRILRRTANVGLLYVAIDGVLKLSYEIEYQTKPEFEDLIRELAEDGTAVAICSYDPNLNETFLQKSRPDATEDVTVIKPDRYEGEKPLETVDTGAVALKRLTDIVYPIHAAASVDRLHRFCNRIQLIASLLGGVALAILTVFGQLDAVGLLPVVGYQLFWIAVSAIAFHSELRQNRPD